MISEALSSSGISETAITLSYRLARNMNRESPPRTHSRSTRSTSSRSTDSRTYSRRRRSRHHRSRSPNRRYRSRSPNRQTEEIEVKDEHKYIFKKAFVSYHFQIFKQ
ncbi:hypothetical protein TNCV_3317141 [Trichonephila clavipes]|nr:hypothetical protein TNCV_3317141 [Trichonephila clavipes]